MTSSGCSRCDSPPRTEVHTIPELEWAPPRLPDYETATPHDADRARRKGLDTLKEGLDLPRALETRLRGEPLEIWRSALEAIERYRILADSTYRFASAPTPDESVCETNPAPSALPVRWTIRAQQLGQQRRNVLWRLGRLELAARSVHEQLATMGRAFGSDRSKRASDALLLPLKEIGARLESYDTEATRPDGDWSDASLFSRMARHRPLLLLLTHAEEALEAWREKTREDERWSYAAPTADAPLKSIASWHQEHDHLVEAVGTYSSVANAFATSIDVARASDDPFRKCIALQTGGLARLSTVMHNNLQMQRELAVAGRELRRLLSALHQRDDRSVDAEIASVSELLESTQRAASGLMALEAATLRRWDHRARSMWRELFPSVLYAEENPVPPDTRERAAWRATFFDARDGTRPGRTHVSPEPEQPPNRRGKPGDPFVSEVLDLARSPGRVAEVEQGLLAMSELDAHMQAMHDVIVRACREGDCAGLPGPSVPDSPRSSEWVAHWREQPVEAHTLGHNALVLELSRLHLGRQVERLADIHGWFAELSSADLSWFRLPDWQQTWSLYTGPRGSYLSFLRAIAHVDRTVDAFDANRGESRVSARMAELLEYQALLFELTLDYARFVDRGGAPPVPVDTLLGAWRALARELLAVEAATIARDERLAAKREAEREAAEEARREAERKAREEADGGSGDTPDDESEDSAE